MTGRTYAKGCIAAMVLAVSTLGAHASMIGLTEKSLTDVLGGTAASVGTMETTVMNSGNMRSAVKSQAYTDGDGHYAYLYQVLNTGGPTNSPIEMFTAWPFPTTSETSMGYLTGTMPTDFLAGGKAPELDGFNDEDTQEISFYFTKRIGKQIPVGQHSLVLYITSSLPPDEITGNVIDGSVGSGSVVGPVPEPATMSLLALGGLAMLRRHKK